MGLPVPDKVIFLNMPPYLSDKLIENRAKKTNTAKDIHEKDTAYLARCHMVYEQMAQKYDWDIVDCAKDGALRSIEDIHEDVFSAIKMYL